MTKKDVLCPNCFGRIHREVFMTATSRNIVHDDSPPSLQGAGLSTGSFAGSSNRSAFTAATN